MHFLSAAKPTDKGMHSVVLVFVVGVGRRGPLFPLCAVLESSIQKLPDFLF